MPKPERRDPESLLPIPAAFLHILVALAEGELHGYGIMLDVAERTSGKLRMGPGTLYGSLKRMLQDGLIAESGERPDPDSDDERRRYYEITEFGRAVAAAETARMAKIVSQARARKLAPKGI